MANEKPLDLSTLQAGLKRYDDSLADVAKSGDYDDLNNSPVFELPKTDEYISLEVTGSKYIGDDNQEEDFNALMNCLKECYDSDIKSRDAIVLKINDDEYTGTNTIGYSRATWTFPSANLKVVFSNISRPVPEGTLSTAVEPQIDFDMIDSSGDSTVYDAIQAGDIVQFPVPPIVYAAVVNTDKLAELRESVTLSSLTTTVIIDANDQTGTKATGIKRSAMVGIVLFKNDDVYYNPIIYSVYENGTIECRTTVMGNKDTQNARSYTFQVFYLPSLNT